MFFARTTFNLALVTDLVANVQEVSESDAVSSAEHSTLRPPALTAAAVPHN